MITNMEVNINPEDSTNVTNIVSFYDNVAQTLGFDKDKVLYDCTKIDVSKNIQDNIYEVWEKMGAPDAEIAITWLNSGPKADDKLPDDTIRISHGFFRDHNNEPVPFKNDICHIKNKSGKVIFRYPDTTMKETLEAAVKEGVDLSLADLRGADLTDANLAGAILRGADLSQANLTGANLTGANLRDAMFHQAILNGACFRSANLRRAFLLCAELSKADLRWANIDNADLSMANLSGADLREAELETAKLTQTNLCGADLRESNLTDARFREANLTQANLFQSILRDADFRHADLREADLGQTDLRDANMTGANLTDAILRGADMEDADFSDAILRGAALELVNLYKSSLTGVDTATQTHNVKEKGQNVEAYLIFDNGGGITLNTISEHGVYAHRYTNEIRAANDWKLILEGADPIADAWDGNDIKEYLDNEISFNQLSLEEMRDQPESWYLTLQDFADGKQPSDDHGGMAARLFFKELYRHDLQAGIEEKDSEKHFIKPTTDDTPSPSGFNHGM